MDLFTQVKMAVSVKEAAEYYGLEVKRGNMVCCPFHNDRTPSMKLNEDYFYCFGCGATGDVIDLVAKLFNLSSYDAAKKLADDFGIDPDKPPAAAALRKPKYPLAKAFQKEELHCQRILYDYLHLLERWKMQYAPKTPEDLRAPAETQRSGFGGKRTSDRERVLPLAAGRGIRRPLGRRPASHLSGLRRSRCPAKCTGRGMAPHPQAAGRSPHPLLATIGEKHEKRYQIQHAHGVR